jgi:hypothetical protein
MQMKWLRKILLATSCLMLAASLMKLFFLGWTDVQRGFLFDERHAKLVSPPILLIGLAFTTFQFASRQPWSKKIKGFLLGLAFAIWGSETYLPGAAWVTMLDDLAMTVFVADLGWIIGSECFSKSAANRAAG